MPCPKRHAVVLLQKVHECVVFRSHLILIFSKYLLFDFSIFCLSMEGNFCSSMIPLLLPLVQKLENSNQWFLSAEHIQQMDNIKWNHCSCKCTRYLHSKVRKFHTLVLIK